MGENRRLQASTIMVAGSEGEKIDRGSWLDYPHMNRVREMLEEKFKV